MLNKYKHTLRSLTVRWNTFVGSAGALYFSLQDSIPELKAMLDGKALAAFIVANALVGLYLRQRTTKPLGDYRNDGPR